MANQGYCDDCGRQVASDDLLMSATGLRCMDCAQGNPPEKRADSERSSMCSTPKRSCRIPAMLMLFLAGVLFVFVVSHIMARQMMICRSGQDYRPIVKLQAVQQAQDKYAALHADQGELPIYATTLEELQEANLLPSNFNERSRYGLTLESKDGSWQVVATPKGFKGASFFLDDSGVLRWSRCGEATAESPVFELATAQKAKKAKKECGYKMRQCRR